MSMVAEYLRERETCRRRRIILLSSVFIISLLSALEHWHILEVSNGRMALRDSRFFGLASYELKNVSVIDVSSVEICNKFGGRGGHCVLKIICHRTDLFYSMIFSCRDGANEEKRSLMLAIKNGGNYRTTIQVFRLGWIGCLISGVWLLLIYLHGRGVVN